MSFENAEPTSSRRSLLGATGAAGITAAIASLAVARPASAAPPFSPTSADTELLRQAMELELAARDLYETTLAAGISSDVQQLVELMASNHNDYAKGIAGIAGLSASGRNDEVFDQLESTFDTTDVTAFATAGASLENTAAATHTALMAQYEAENAIVFTASVVMVEARAGVVLSHLEGITEAATLLSPDGEALSLSGDSGASS